MSQKSNGNISLPIPDADASKDRARDEGGKSDDSVHEFTQIDFLQDKLIEHNARIGELISDITISLKGSLKKSNNNTADSSEYKKAVFENGSTQTDPLIKPGLQMIADRTGDSVACQTVEQDPFANF